MAFLPAEARRAGAEVRFGSPFTGATRGRDTLTLDGHSVAARFLVGADGVHSKVARAMGFDRNHRLLKGVEWEYEPLDGVGDCLHCFVDPAVAPGYIGWIVPGVDMTQIGLALHDCHKADVAGFVDRLSTRFGLRTKRVLAKRGGMIPINGLPNASTTIGFCSSATRPAWSRHSPQAASTRAIVSANAPPMPSPTTSKETVPIPATSSPPAIGTAPGSTARDGATTTSRWPDVWNSG